MPVTLSIHQPRIPQSRALVLSRLPCLCGVALYAVISFSARILQPDWLLRHSFVPSSHPVILCSIIHHPSSISHARFLLIWTAANRTSEYQGAPWRTSRSLYTVLFIRFSSFVSIGCRYLRRHLGQTNILPSIRSSGEPTIEPRAFEHRLRASANQPKAATQSSRVSVGDSISRAITTDNNSPSSGR
jgi:hypothetical protein